MRLVDVVNQVRRKANEGTNFVRYPMQMVSQGLWRVGQQWYENVQLPGKETKQTGDRDSKKSPEFEVEAAPTAYRSPEFPAERQPFVLAGSSTAVSSGLLPGTPLKSRWNSYTIGICLESSGTTRLYEGKTRSDEPVLIKEYQLLDYDNSREVEARQQAFERLIELNQKIGHGPDFRIVKLIDAIALPKERSCYLVTKPINHNTTLETYLAQYGLMTAKQIREVLRQVLESLRFLHTAYRVHFPSGESERGLPHGNLSLKSLLVRQIERGANADRQFFIYLSNLELWEHLFYPIASPKFHAAIAKSTRDLGSVNQDLMDLGSIGLQLAGGTLDSTPERLPEQEQIICDLNDPPLLHFIQRLLGLVSPFNTAEEALHTLLQLPEPSQIPVALVPSEAALEKSDPANRLGLILAIAFLFIGFLGLTTWLLRRDPSANVVTSPLPPLLTNTPEDLRIAEVTLAPPRLTYVVEPQGAWHYAIARQFRSNTALGATFAPENLIEAIENRHGKIVITPFQAASQDVNVRSQLVTGRADVAFMSQPEVSLNGSGLEPEVSLDSLGLEKQTVAYDALVVFVPSSDPYHFNRNPEIQAINRSISIDELRQLYTSDVVTDTVTVPFPGKEFQVKLFFSEDLETVQRFKSQVLNNDPTLIDKFERLQARARLRDEQAALSDRAPLDVYNRIWADSNQSGNQEVIEIGFDRLGRMYDQCSVYPLAIRGETQTTQVLIRSNGKPVDRNIDLCGEKGSYLPNLQGYPPELIYELALVYRKDSPAGTALAKMLRTIEGQYLMSKVGLIPEEPIPELLSAIWGNAND